MTTGAPRDPTDTRTNVIRIHDPQVPQRTPAQQAAWEHGRKLKVDLDSDRLLQEAMERAWPKKRVAELTEQRA